MHILSKLATSSKVEASHDRQVIMRVQRLIVCHGNVLVQTNQLLNLVSTRLDPDDIFFVIMLHV
jgi:hypothetical protein